MPNDLKERDPLTLEMATLLTVLRFKGMVARAITLRGVEPSLKEMRLLEEEDFSMRSLAEVLHDLGFTFECGLVDIPKETPDADA